MISVKHITLRAVAYAIVSIVCFVGGVACMSFRNEYPNFVLLSMALTACSIVYAMNAMLAVEMSQAGMTMADYKDD